MTKLDETVKPQAKLPQPVETYVRAINTRDEQLFTSSFNHDALVKDVGRQILGLAAITEWARHEIFAVNVSLDVMKSRGCDGQTVITVEVDGTFDRSGLPDPLVMEHWLTIREDKIAELTCRLAGPEVS